MKLASICLVFVHLFFLNKGNAFFYSAGNCSLVTQDLKITVRNLQIELGHILNMQILMIVVLMFIMIFITSISLSVKLIIGNYYYCLTVLH